MGNTLSGGEKDCKHYGPQDILVDDTPPTVPQDTVTAFYALTRSGDHRRSDACYGDALPQPRNSFWNTSGSKDAESSCSESIKPPQLKDLKGKDIREEYFDYVERLRQKHEKESRHIHDKYTTNIDKVEDKFRAAEKEPVCAELEAALYASLRKNRLRPLDSYADCQSYTHAIRRNAALCFRLAPESKRKQKACDAEYQIIRETPREPDDYDNTEVTPPVTKFGADEDLAEVVLPPSEVQVPKIDLMPGSQESSVE